MKKSDEKRERERERDRGMENRNRVRKEYNNVACSIGEDEKKRQGRHRGNREDERDGTVEARYSPEWGTRSLPRSK